MSQSNDLSRRDLLITAATLTGGVLAAPLDAAPINDTGGDLGERRRAAQNLRVELAKYYSTRPVRHHPTNGDEEEITEHNRRTYVANYSKGLPHNEVGEVDFAAYQSLLAALEMKIRNDLSARWATVRPKMRLSMA